MKKNVEKAVYPGNMGFTEMYNLVRNAPPEVGNQFLTLVRADKYTEAIKIMEDFHHIKFDPSIYGKQIWMQGGHTAHRRAQRLERNQAIRERNKKKMEQPKKFFLTGEVMSGMKKADVTKGKRMKQIIIQKANVDGYYREKDGKQQFVKSHIRHVVTTERLLDSDLQKAHKIFVPAGKRKAYWRMDSREKKLARDMGAAAFKAGKPPVPALNKEFLDTFVKPGAEIGSSTPAMKEYARGWHEANLKPAGIREMMGIFGHAGEGKEPYETTLQDIEYYKELVRKYANSKKLIDEDTRVTTGALGLGGSDLTYAARSTATEIGHYLQDLPDLISEVPKEEIPFLMQILEQNNMIAYKKVTEYLKKAFRLASYTHTLGKEESRRSKREKAQSGDWTPHEQRFRERAKQRREDYSGGEG